MSQSFDGNETKDEPREDVPPTSPSSVTVASSTTSAGNERTSSEPIFDAGIKRGSSKPLVDKDESDISKAKEPDNPISRVHLRCRIGAIVIAVVLAIVAIAVPIVILSKPDPPTPTLAPMLTRESHTPSMTTEEQFTTDNPVVMPVSNAPVPISQNMNDTTNPIISPPTVTPIAPTNPPSRTQSDTPTSNPIETPSHKPSIHPIVITNVPVITSSPTTAPTEQQLTVACNFLNYLNVTECQSNTDFQSDTVGNTIPIEIGLLTQLTYLELDRQELYGTIPSELGNLINLKVLILGNNLLSSTIPSELGNLGAMNFFNLGTNQLNGTIPSTFGNLLYVTNMYLDNNELTGLIPSSALENLLNLNELDLYANPMLFGTIPASMCNRSNIVIGIDCSTGRIACSCCGYSNRTECPSTGGGYYGGGYYGGF